MGAPGLAGWLAANKFATSTRPKHNWNSPGPTRARPEYWREAGGKRAPARRPVSQQRAQRARARLEPTSIEPEMVAHVNKGARSPARSPASLVAAHPLARDSFKMVAGRVRGARVPYSARNPGKLAIRITDLRTLLAARSILDGLAGAPLRLRASERADAVCLVAQPATLDERLS